MPGKVACAWARRACKSRLVGPGVQVQVRVQVQGQVQVSLYRPEGQTLFFDFFMLKCFIGS